jgi:chemotaxis protein MotC
VRLSTLARCAHALRAGACGAALLLGVPAGAQDLAPWQMVRSLQLLQDRIADGDAAALPMQRTLLGITDKRLQTLSPADLADGRNFDAVMVYGMGGGNPATLQALMPALLAAADTLDAPPPSDAAEEEGHGEEAPAHADADAEKHGDGAAQAEASAPEHDPADDAGAEAAEAPAPAVKPAQEPAHAEARPALPSEHAGGENDGVPPGAAGHGDAATAGGRHGEGPSPPANPDHQTDERAEEGGGHAEPAANRPNGHGAAEDALTTGSVAEQHGASAGGHEEKADGETAPAPPPGQRRRLALGVYNYGRGRLPDARTALGPVDPLRERAEVGSYLALVKGSLLATEDPAAALRLLDTARLLGTGTLVEEAALRRSVALAATLGERRRFLLAAGQYIRRFLRSPYASQFADALVAGAVTLHDGLDLDALAAVTAGLTPEQERVVYLRIARRAAIDNLAVLSAFASVKAGAEDAEGAADPRAALYAALPDVAAPDAAETLKRLEAIDPGGLTPGDRALLDAAKTVAGETLAAPAPRPAATPPAPQAEPPAPLAPPSPGLEPPSQGDEPLESVEDPAPRGNAARDAGADAGGISVPELAVGDAPQERSDELAPPPDAADAKMAEARRTLEAVDQILKDSMK